MATPRGRLPMQALANIPEAYWLDLAAFGWFVVLTLLYVAISGTGRTGGRSIMAAIHARRVEWMRNMAQRETRTEDLILLQNLATANTFFASTSVIAIGGLAALLGSGDRVTAILAIIPFVAKAEPIMFELKIFFLMLLFIYAFFKFAWAYRLAHYTAIMIGSTPIAAPEHAEACERYARSAARLAGLSAEHANAGFRTYYFAIAGITWFLHPLIFMGATLWVLVILVRREFFSRSRRAILGV
ncbi:MAG: DUF599 family protein [Hyphomicrobiaceae bacterium]|nr:MAG: DUF599 family protein [Hyphomicrobiaceae bacterium]